LLKSFPVDKYAMTVLRNFLFLALILSTMIFLSQSVAHAQVASPISRVPTDTIIPGELVWADLVTTDVDKAVDFYTEVFGWEAHKGEDSAYVELANDGELICAVAGFNDQDVTPGNARWLVSISVADVDGVAEKFEKHGGRVLEAAYDFPNRGRLAVVGDDQGAILMLLRASGGDPQSFDHAAGGWGFAELWTHDVEKAVAFYKETIGYRATRVPGDDGQQSMILSTQNHPRATVVKIPGDSVQPNWLPYVMVADVPATLQGIRNAGGFVLMTSDEITNDAGTFAAIVVDSTGGVFAIQEMEASQ
jgi:predicted enzyme related to lactoylglutathione lyase